MTEALNLASAISTNQKHSNLEFLISKWSAESHTVVAAYGEFAPLLEEVSALTMLPLFGYTHSMGVVIDKKSQEKLDILNKALFESRSSSTKATLLLGFGISKKKARTVNIR